MTPAERSLVILVAIMILYITELIPLAVTATQIGRASCRERV